MELRSDEWTRAVEMLEPVFEVLTRSFRFSSILPGVLSAAAVAGCGAGQRFRQAQEMPSCAAPPSARLRYTSSCVGDRHFRATTVSIRRLVSGTPAGSLLPPPPLALLGSQKVSALFAKGVDRDDFGFVFLRLCSRTLGLCRFARFLTLLCRRRFRQRRGLGQGLQNA